MSVKVMGLVWDLDGLTSSEKLVLLAYADHADHDGRGIWPAVATVARKTALSERTVQRVSRALVEKDLLIRDGKHKSGTNLWKIPIPDVGGDMVSPPEETESITPDTVSPGGVTESHRGGDRVTPDPSINHKNAKPSKKKSRKRDKRLDHPAIIAYREEARLHVPISWRDEVINTVNDVDKWKEIVHSWIGHGWNKQNIKDMLKVYNNGWGRGKKDKDIHSVFDRMRELGYE